MNTLRFSRWNMHICNKRTPQSLLLPALYLDLKLGIEMFVEKYNNYVALSDGEVVAFKPLTHSEINYLIDCSIV